jgi:GT2 family glycosyltransferase
MEKEFVSSLFSTKNKGDLIWQPLDNRPVDEARNKLGLTFLNYEAKFDFILYADSDAVWHPDAVMRLAERNLPVVTAGIYRRKLPPLPTIGQYVGRNSNGHHVYEFASVIGKLVDYARAHGIGDDTHNAMVLDKGDEVDDLLEVGGCGCHFLMVRRDVLEALRLPFFMSQGRNAGGEDFYFSRKVKDAGFPIYFDLTVHTGHLAGPDTDFGIRELMAFFKYVRPEDILVEEGEGVLDAG